MRGKPSSNPVPDHRMTQCLFFPLIFFAGGGSSAATMAFQMCQWLSFTKLKQTGRSVEAKLWDEKGEADLTSSNTSFSLYCVNAEHSTYLTAPSSFAMRSPSSLRTGCMRCLASLSRTCGSSRRSVCVPTMRHGTPGQWWWTSGNHFSRTFSNDAGDVTLKQTRKTSVWGYERGRRRS